MAFYAGILFGIATYQVVEAEVWTREAAKTYWLSVIACGFDIWVIRFCLRRKIL
jgi:hypothetical protein